MHIASILNKLLSNVTTKKRMTTLACLVDGVFQCKHVTLTNLGRALKINIQERSMVRRVDRFLSNEHFKKEHKEIYKQICSKIIGKKKCVNLIVDWSSLPNSSEYLLRVSIPFDGRDLPIYQEVFEEKYYGTQSSQSIFKKFKGNFT